MKDSYLKTKIAQVDRLIKQLSNTDLAQALSRIDELESLTSAQAITISELQSIITDYTSHTHDYEDKHGTITETKTTQGVNQ